MSITPWHRSSAFTYVHERTMGFTNSYIDRVNAHRTRNLQPSSSEYLILPKSSIYSMALDPIYDQFLLISTSKSQILLHNVHLIANRHTNSHTPTEIVSPNPSLIHSFHVAPHEKPQLQARAAQYGIPSVSWYPVDAGLFAIASYGQTDNIQVYDANTFTSVLSFRLQSKVFNAKFSPCATLHSLIAASLGNGEVRLCDMESQSSTHTLFGHRDPVWSLAYSPVNEFQLATACTRGEIRIWDIRRSGSAACLYCLNKDGEASVPGRAVAWEASSSVRRHGAVNSKREPHVAASYAFVRAHNGAIRSLCYTPNGRYLLSSGGDNALRLWHTGTGRHELIHYQGVKGNCHTGSFQMQCVQEADEYASTIVFHPNGENGELACYPVHLEGEKAFTQGKEKGLMGVPLSKGRAPCMEAKAHYASIRACVYRKSCMELYTGGEDGMIMRWKHVEKEKDDGIVVKEAADSWSDEESEGLCAYVPPISMR